MYLIHVALRPTTPTAVLPRTAGDLLLAVALPDERIEHVVLHPCASPCPVLGVYLLADCIEDAEERATEFCRRALAALPALAGWEPGSAEVPLVGPFYEGLLSASGLTGRNGPWTLSST